MELPGAGEPPAPQGTGTMPRHCNKHRGERKPFVSPLLHPCPPTRLLLGNNLTLTRANALCLADHNPGQSVVRGVKSEPHAGGCGTTQLCYLLFGVCFSCAERLCFWAMP